AAFVGYRPIALRASRSRTLSTSLNLRIAAVVSPISVSGSMMLPRSLKHCDHRSILGLKNLTNSPVRFDMDPMSLPLCRLQKRQQYARFSDSVGPPCFRLIM